LKKNELEEEESRRNNCSNFHTYLLNRVSHVGGTMGRTPLMIVSGTRNSSMLWKARSDVRSCQKNAISELEEKKCEEEEEKRKK
jgi:hypothetical protein